MGGPAHHASVKKHDLSGTKANRRNAAKMQLQKKRQELTAARRAGTTEGAPKLIVRRRILGLGCGRVAPDVSRTVAVAGCRR